MSEIEQVPPTYRVQKQTNQAHDDDGQDRANHVLDAVQFLMNLREVVDLFLFREVKRAVGIPVNVWIVVLAHTASLSPTHSTLKVGA